MGVDDFDALSVTDSGVFSDNDGCSSGRSSPVSCKESVVGVERERFAILTYEQVKRIDSVLNEMVALEGRGNFPSLELKLKDLLTAVKDRLLKEGLKIRDIRLNGGAASYALMPEQQTDYCYVCGYGYPSTSGNEDSGLMCSCNVIANVTAAAAAAAEHCTNGGIMTVNSLMGSGARSNCSYNDIDLIFGMELSTAKHFDRVKTAVLDALLDLLPPQVSRKRMSACALKEAYVSKMVKVCEGDRWSLIALGNGQPTHGPGNGNKSRGCSVELKFVDTMRRQYEFSVDSFQIVLDSLMLFYKCATVPMSSRFYPTIVGESVYGDFSEALFHLHHGLIATRSPEEIRGGGLLKYCNLLVRGYRPADIHSIQPLQRYMCSRFFIDFPEVDQQEGKLRTYLANHMSGASLRLRYAFLITLYNVVDSSTVCLMGHERRLTLQLIQRLACQLFSNDFATQGLYSNSGYTCYPLYYLPSQAATSAQSQQHGQNGQSGHYEVQQTMYYGQPGGLIQTIPATSNPGSSTTSSGGSSLPGGSPSSSTSTTTIATNNNSIVFHYQPKPVSHHNGRYNNGGYHHYQHNVSKSAGGVKYNSNNNNNMKPNKYNQTPHPKPAVVISNNNNVSVESSDSSSSNRSSGKFLKDSSSTTCSATTDLSTSSTAAPIPVVHLTAGKPVVTVS